MASACVNNVGVSPEPAFLDFQAGCPAYGWLSPRISFGRDASSDSGPATDPASSTASTAPKSDAGDEEKTSPVVSADEGCEVLELAGVDLLDFEFHLDDPIAMLPADELFSDGKLMPLQMPAMRPLPELKPAEEVQPQEEAAAVLDDADRVEQIHRSDPYLQSPRAPRCSSRWRDLLLGMRKQQNPRSEPQNLASSPSKNANRNIKSLRQLLNRHQKTSAGDPSLSFPLLRDSDSDPVSISSRRSLSSSSSSSGADHDDPPRLSLDAEKRDKAPISLSRPPPRVRLVRQRPATEGHPPARAEPPAASAAARSDCGQPEDECLRKGGVRGTRAEFEQPG